MKSSIFLQQLVAPRRIVLYALGLSALMVGVFLFSRSSEAKQSAYFTVISSRQGFVFHPLSESFTNLSADGMAGFMAVDCSFQIAPVNSSFPANGGSGTVNVTANDSLCSWTAASDVPWITITSGATGVGSGAVNFSVSPANVARSGTLRIANNVFTVWQELSPCSTPTFNASSKLLDPPGGFYVVSKDVNNDGRIDLAVADDSVIRVFLKGSDGSLTLSATLTGTASGSNHVFVAADFNGDGKQDIANINGTVSLRLGDGMGGFGSPANFAVGQNPSFLDVGNFNGDALADLVVTNFDSGNFSVLLGHATLGFSPGQTGSAGNIPQPRSVVAADFNNDNKGDFATLGAFGVHVLLGDGTGNFGAPQVFSSGGFNNFHINKGDFDADGKLDLVVATNNLTVLKGNGTGNFAAPLTLFSGFFSSFAAVGDFNGDGRSDIAAGSFTNQVQVFLSNAVGFSPVKNFLSGHTARQMSVSDFDGDSKQDLIVADSGLFASGNGVQLMKGDGLGNFTGGRGSFLLNAAHPAVSGDFNSDGRPDLVLSGGAGSIVGGISFMPGIGNAEFGVGALITQNVQPFSLFAEDFNRDSRLDIAVHERDLITGSKERVRVFLGNGGGSFTQRSDTLLNTFNAVAAFDDFNGDGTPDLIATDSASALTIRISDGAGGFSAPTTFSTGLQPTSLVAGDFNGDGRADVLTLAPLMSGDCSMTLNTFHGNGSGGFSAPSASTMFGTITPASVGDLNGDGKSDLVAVNGCTNKVILQISNNSGGFTASPEITLADDPHRVAIGDLSGDGKPDVVVTNGDNTGVVNAASILVGNGQGSFSAPITIVAGRGASTPLIADFDSDGHNDLAVTDLAAQHVGVFQNTCALASPSSTVQFGVGSLLASESDFQVTISVTRSGDTSSAATVGYTTISSSASERSDYTAASGTLTFAPGETSKSFQVLLTDDAHVEGFESLAIALSNPANVALGSPNSILLTIVDNDSSPTSNPADNSTFFVRQHYHDFLNREPDALGLQFWVDNIEVCGSDTQCREVKRINTSAAFFLSIEFQNTGYLVYRMYKAAYGDTTSPNVSVPVPIIKLIEFLPDTQRIGLGVVVGQGNWEQVLAQNKVAYALDFVQRQRFITAFPLSMTADQFVTKLDENAGGVLSPTEKSNLIAMLGGTPSDVNKRAMVLRAVAEDADLQQREFNRAFVLMQYFGYLRRNPDDPPDTDFRGWEFWLNKLNQFNGNFINAEMVKAFISSIEYRQRFGP